MKKSWPVLLGFLLWLAPAAQAQFTYTTNADGLSATITGYTGSGGTAGIPATTNGLQVTAIAAKAFYGCYSMTNVSIPSSVTSIGGGAFKDCPRLYSVTIPASITNVGGEAFDDCIGLTAINVEPANSFYSSAGGVLFDISQSTLIQYPAGLVGNYTIPGTVTSIGEDAFDGCASLTNVTIPSSVTNIGSGAFNPCTDLTNITIPCSVASIGAAAFDDCIRLTAIDVDAANSFYSSVNGVLFDRNQSTLIQYPAGLGGNYTIPGSVTSIGDYAFDDCVSLASVTIPVSVTNIGDYAFYECSGLTNATMAGGVTNIGNYAFFLCSLLPSISIPSSVTNIGEGTFAYCSSLTNAAIPGSVTSIGDHAFDNCSSLISVTIPGSVTNIGDYAFYDCSGLTSVTIADGVSTIGNYGFEYCASLVSVTIPASVTSVGRQAFAYCSRLTAINVDPANLFYSSVNGVLFDKSQSTLIAYPGGLGGKYAIPASVSSLGDYAFCGCSSPVSVAIPGSVTNFGNFQFYDCIGLTNATIGNGVSSLGNYAFYLSAHLTNVAIAASVTNIGSAFNYCYHLTNVFFQGSPPPGYAGAFASAYKNMIYDNAAVFCLPGASGWGSTFDGLPVVSWNPLIQTAGSGFGVQTNHFGFNITGTVNIPIMVEACTNLAGPVWTPLQSLKLTNGSVYFSEALPPGTPGRYYRISSP